MMMDDHQHNWKVFEMPDMLWCPMDGCRTVAPLSTVIANVQADAAHQTKIHLLVKQLRDRELKKPARDAAYLWVTANAPSSKVRLLESTQASLL